MQSFTHDPNAYLNGNNGLTVADARDRVYSRAIDTLGDGSPDGGGFTILERLGVWAAVDGAVSTGASRHDLYRTAGEVAADARAGVEVFADGSSASEFARRVRDAYGLAPVA